MLMGLKPGMKVLDVGCGIGGPAREIAKFVGCEVVGVTINQAQVDRAIYLTATERLEGRCTFVRGDFLVRTTTFWLFDLLSNYCYVFPYPYHSHPWNIRGPRWASGTNSGRCYVEEVFVLNSTLCLVLVLLCIQIQDCWLA